MSTAADSDNVDAQTIATANAQETDQGAAAVDRIFDRVDTDGSGGIDMEEYNRHLRSLQVQGGGGQRYTQDAITDSFVKMDSDRNGEISRQEFRRALLHAASYPTDNASCPMGYFLNSVKQTCEPLGPVGRFSQRLENLGPLKRAYRRISNLFGMDAHQVISKLGVSFLLSYSLISNLNGALSFSVAWYLSIKRTGLSPMVPGQWKSLLTSYAMIYGAIQILKPFRVAAAIAMSKLSAEYLEMTQHKLNCSRRVAIACQYVMGQVVMAVCALLGVTAVSLWTGVPLMGQLP